MLKDVLLCLGLPKQYEVRKRGGDILRTELPEEFLWDCYLTGTLSPRKPYDLRPTELPMEGRGDLIPGLLKRDELLPSRVWSSPSRLCPSRDSKYGP
ncbi:MAG: hypothetical protein ABIM02_00330 [candidate division WOR-3 bacterium]